MSVDLSTILNPTIEIAKKAGNFIRKEREEFHSGKVITKGQNDFVSHVDKSAEVMIIDKLNGLIPDAGFIAEEGTSTKIGDVYNWIIDPLDGTTNFIHGTPPYAVSIGLKRNDDMVLGVIYEITLDECFYAIEGQPAYLNGKVIKVSEAKTVNDSLIATGFPYTDFHRIEAFMGTLQDLFKNTHGIRRLGSAATDLAYVACGRFDAFYEYNLKPWDVAAGVFLVQQAGGKITDFKDTNDYIFSGETVASNKIIHKEFLERVGCLKIENFI